MRFRTFRMASSPGISSVGVLNWAMNAYKFKRDRKQMVMALSEGWRGPTDDDYHKLLSGEVPYKIDGETVEFSILDASPAELITLYQAAKALDEILDGQRDHDLKAQTGFPDERCAEIAEIKKEVRKLFDEST